MASQPFNCLVYQGNDSGECLRFAGWRLDIGLRLLFDPTSRLISLSDGEFRLLRAFAEHPRRMLTRDQLLGWSRGEGSKLAEGKSGSEIARTVRNEAYLFPPSVTVQFEPVSSRTIVANLAKQAKFA